MTDPVPAVVRIGILPARDAAIALAHGAAARLGLGDRARADLELELDLAAHDGILGWIGAAAVVANRLRAHGVGVEGGPGRERFGRLFWCLGLAPLDPDDDVLALAPRRDTDCAERSASFFLQVPRGELARVGALLDTEIAALPKQPCVVIAEAPRLANFWRRRRDEGQSPDLLAYPWRAGGPTPIELVTRAVDDERIRNAAGDDVGDAISLIRPATIDDFVVCCGLARPCGLAGNPSLARQYGDAILLPSGGASRLPRG